MTSVFSWQNSVSLGPALFCTPRPNLPVFQVSLDFLLLHVNLLGQYCKVNILLLKIKLNLQIIINK